MQSPGVDQEGGGGAEVATPPFRLSCYYCMIEMITNKVKFSIIEANFAEKKLLIRN